MTIKHTPLTVQAIIDISAEDKQSIIARLIKSDEVKCDLVAALEAVLAVCGPKDTGIPQDIIRAALAKGKGEPE